MASMQSLRFMRVSGGWEWHLDEWERAFLIDLLTQLAYVLSCDDEASATKSVSRPGPMDVRKGESEREHHILAALDFASEENTEACHNEAPAAGGGVGEEHRQRSAWPSASAEDEPGAATDGSQVSSLDSQVAPLLDVLLPDPCEDPEVAVEISAMTRRRLRDLKWNRTSALITQLREPTGIGGAVRVEAGREGDWLGAFNDLRLLLAQRLDIHDEASADRAYALASEEPVEEDKDVDAQQRGLAITYAVMTWWQESLLAVLGSDGAPA